MKKGLIIGLAVLMVIGLSTMVIAQTTSDSYWSGAGTFDTHFYSGDDAEAHFWTGGNSISGEFHGTDSGNNPYGYSVDDTNVNTRADVNNGYMEFKFERTDFATHPSAGEGGTTPYMYGDAGQESYTWVTASDAATFDWNATTNYAGMKCCNYGFQNNNQITANGDFYVEHYIIDGDTVGFSSPWTATFGNMEGGFYTAGGTGGSVTINDMSDEAGGSSFNLGKGCGCYTNASISGTNGSAQVGGQAQNVVNGPYALSGNWTLASAGGSNFSLPANYDLDGN